MNEVQRKATWAIGHLLNVFAPHERNEIVREILTQYNMGDASELVDFFDRARTARDESLARQTDGS